MCFGGGGGKSTSTSTGKASSKVDFNPSITVSLDPTFTIGGNAGEPTHDTGSTFAAKLLASPPQKISFPDPPTGGATDKTPDQDPNRTKILLYVAVALAARKVLRG